MSGARLLGDLNLARLGLKLVSSSTDNSEGGTAHGKFFFLFFFMGGQYLQLDFFLCVITYRKCPKILYTKVLTKLHMQIVQTQIRLLLEEQSDQGLHHLPFHYVVLRSNNKKQNLGQRTE